MLFEPILYMIAELAENPRGLEFNWTSQAFTDLAEAKQEEVDAHRAGYVHEQVFEFRPARHLAAVPPLSN